VAGTTLRRVYVRLDNADVERLVRRALRERRHPADEAALLLSQALRAGDVVGEQRRDAVAV
jgi:hypothetical protein